MSINISETQRVTVWQIEDKGKFAQVRLSSSRKDKKSGEYINSNWSFVRFVGQAYEKISTEGLAEKDRIVLKGATFSLESYIDQEGTKQYPKHPTFTVFNWEHAEAPQSGDAPPKVESSVPEEDDSEIPF